MVFMYFSEFVKQEKYINLHLNCNKRRISFEETPKFYEYSSKIPLNLIKTTNLTTKNLKTSKTTIINQNFDKNKL